MRIKASSFLHLVILHGAVILISLVFLFQHKGEPRRGRDKVVVVPIQGIISSQRGSMERGESVESLIETINELKDDDTVRALVLRIDSPGGSVGAVQEVAGALKKFKAKGKFIVSSFGDVAASGGYYVACAGDAIVSQPGTLTGSIGVIMQLPNVEGLTKKIGVNFETIKSGSMKDSGSPFRSLTGSERQVFQDLIMDAYDQFFQAVKEGRKMEDAALKPLADGRVFSGRQALKNKLVDGLGGVDEAIGKAKSLAGIETKNPEIVYHKEKKSLERLLQLLSRSPLDGLSALARTEVGLHYLMQ